MLRAALGVGNVPRSTQSPFPFQVVFYWEQNALCEEYRGGKRHLLGLKAWT